ncbi:DUF692 domain-containing protein [Luteibacter anthropi]|uniref:MNIO family bufferin maturase n=1 Tax=Luteibacter anthropi TaxID=564369 RepID=UPI002032774F|nr:DUF692 domain-containing protein [Luteibacter anthropi]URX64259.1 DUF692 domain-containing protein [Luteibacter anthropi]
MSTLTAGLGFKPQHIDEALACAEPGVWLEVHPENYMVDGGPRLAMLDALAQHHPLSLHGVSLSLGSPVAPDTRHLARLRRLVDRVQPAMVSEHLAWSSWEGRYLPDLLPFPRSTEALLRVVENVQRTQDALGRRIAVENPSHYVVVEGHEWSETDFLAELARRSGCGLLLDINNVHVSAHNLGYDAREYLDAFALHEVMEIHLAGYAVDESTSGSLLIDSHDAPVDDAVWSLYAAVIEHGGQRPTLIERDGDVPSFATLLDERSRAHHLLRHGEVA